VLVTGLATCFWYNKKVIFGSWIKKFESVEEPTTLFYDFDVVGPLLRSIFYCVENQNILLLFITSIFYILLNAVGIILLFILILIFLYGISILLKELFYLSLKFLNFLKEYVKEKKNKRSKFNISKDKKQ